MKKILVLSIILFLTLVFSQDFSGVYKEQSGETSLSLVAVAAGYEGQLVQAEIEVKVVAQVSGGSLQGLLLMKDIGYQKNVYFEAMLDGNQLNLTTAPIDDSGNLDKNYINQYVLIKQSVSAGQNPLGPATNPLGGTTASPSNNPLGANQPTNPLGGSQSTNPLGANNPLGTNTTNPNNQIDFSGVYKEQKSATRIEIYRTTNGYGGFLTDSDLKIRLEAKDINGKLVGRFFYKEAGYAKDLYLEASLVGAELNIGFAPLDEQGNFDRNEMASYVLIKQQANSSGGKIGSSTGKIGSNPPTGNNPLAPSSPVSNNPNQADFSGKYQQADIELIIQKNANGYQGELGFPGKRLSMLAQLNADTLVGKFFADNKEIPFTAKLQGSKLILTIENEAYELMRVSVSEAEQIPTNPLTNRGNNSNNSSSPTQAQNPITVPSSNPSTNSSTNPVAGSAVQSGQMYNSADTVYSPWTGVSFNVPVAYSASYEAQSGFFVLVADNQQSIILLQAASKSSARSIASLAVGFIKETAESEIQFLNNPIEGPNSLQVTINADNTVIQIESKSGANGNAVVALAYGIDAQTLANFVATISLSMPQTQNINLPLGGLALERDSNDGMVGGGLYNKKNEYEAFMFCSDGRYAYEYSSSEDISMGSYSDTWTDSDAHNGNWHPVANLIGETGIMLEATDGRALIYTVSQGPNGVVMNGSEFQVSQNGQCN